VTGPLLEFHRAGKTRILAVTNPTRLNVAPELPTAAELGMPGLTVTGTIGLLAPAGTPTGIIERIAQATRSAVAEPAYQQLLIDAGIEPTLDLRIPTIPARDSNLKAATIPIEGGQHWPVGTFMGHSAGEASRPDRLAAIFRMLSPFNVSR
jgi:hypothetical protein